MKCIKLESGINWFISKKNSEIGYACIIDK
jgi:hypothetical protein